MPANCYVNTSQLTGNNFMAFALGLIFNPKHVGWQVLAKPPVQPAGISGRGWPNGRIVTFVNQLLGVNVGHGLMLEIALFRFAREVVRQGTLNISRMGVVTFDKVGVVAVH